MLLQMQNIYPANFEQKVGFDKVRALVAERCLSQLGVRKIEGAVFQTERGVVARLMNQADEMKRICLLEENFPVEGYIDPTPAFGKIKAQGNWLDERELTDLRRSLSAIKSLLHFVRKNAGKYPAIAKLAADVVYFPFIIDRINGVIDRYGRIKDNASPELAAIRASIHAKQASVSKVVQRILRMAGEQGWIESGTTPAVREGRVVIPIPSTNKRKLKGIVHDESATGKTAFVEPVEVVEVNNEIRELESEERREVVRLLAELTDDIRPYLPELIRAYDFLGDIDSLRAKALFAIDYFGAKPIMRSGAGLLLRQAKHPILLHTLKREGKSIVPLDLELSGENRMLLISGPNAGGKSVCLKTVGLTQYMYQCGFLPALLENSELPVFKRIFIDIGDEQSIENDLSTYSSHLLNMKYFLRNADSDTLILIDEFGSGTEPAAGGAIAEAILKHFVRVGTYGLVTTHYSNLKHFAANTPGVVNGAMLFDNQRIEPLFKLEVGKPGSSFAFEIARKIGLPDEVLADATQKVGDDYITFEKHLRAISRDKRYWERKRDSIRLAAKKAEADREKLENELAELKAKRKEILEQARREAEELLKESNRRIENTIRAIKEAGAQKEETRNARKKLEGFKQQIDQTESSHDAYIEKKMEQIRRREERKKQRKSKQELDSLVQAEEDVPLQVGDKVRVEGSELMGEIVSLSGKSASVAFGSMITVVKLNKLSRISSAQLRKATKAITKPQTDTSFDVYHRRLNFKTDIDIRGYRADEAMEEVMHLVDDALMLGFSTVRILHGKGNGILRQVVRDFLKGTPGVKAYYDEHVERGGTGITVVELEL